MQKMNNRYFPTLTDAAPCSSGVSKRECCRIVRPTSRLLTNTTIAMGSDKAGRGDRYFFAADTKACRLSLGLPGRNTGAPSQFGWRQRGDNRSMEISVAVLACEFVLLLHQKQFGCQTESF